MKGRRTSKTLGAGYTENPGGKGRRPATVSPQSYSQKQHTCIQDRRHPQTLVLYHPADQPHKSLTICSLGVFALYSLSHSSKQLMGYMVGIILQKLARQNSSAYTQMIPPAVCFKADFSHALQLLPSNRREFQVSQCTERAGQAPRVPLSAGSKAHSHTVEPQATPHCSTLHLNRYSPHLTSPSQQLIPVPSPLSPPHVPSRTL